MSIEVGTRVRWPWGNVYGEGRVTEKFEDDVELTIKGTSVKRQATCEEPAFLIEQDDGDEVLKSVSEIAPVA